MSSITIIGGGVIGSSIAFNLLQDGFDGRVTVLERDSSYQFASSALAFGGVRQQFMSALNVQMVKYSLSVLGRFPDCAFRRRGYLFLGTEANWHQLQKRCATQQALGASCELLDNKSIRDLVPELRCDDLAGGLYGPEDGYVDPRALLRAFRRRAETLGAVYVSGELDSIDPETTYVIAAGAYSGIVAEKFALDMPVWPVRQQLFRCALPRPWNYDFPVVIDPSGLHWRSYSDSEIVIAKSNPDEPPGFRFGCDLERFHEELMPALEWRVPEFSGLRLAFGWGGLYEMTPDHNGIIDQVADRVYIAAGFSGHGLMMSAATGKLMAERILTGRFQTLDASLLSFARFARNEPFVDESML